MATFNNGESGLSVRTKINNVLQHADGTASELVINDAGADVNFRVESDTNANALFVDGGTGNVGIGTSSPTSALDVVGTVTADGLTNSGSSTLAGNIFFNSTSGGFRFRTDAGTEKMTLRLDGDDLKLENGAGFERVRFKSGGNVGIGTSAPSTLLQVGVPLTATAGIRVSGANLNVDAGYVSAGVNGTAAAPSLIFGGDANTGFFHPASDELAVSTFGAERMRIDATGNVGIGTSSPTVKLHVEGADNLSTRGRFVNSFSGTTLQLGARRDVSLVPYIGSESNHAFAFITNDTERMRITSTGNVGIGTTTPGSKLSIVGLPTSSAGLSAGDIWNDGGTLKIV